MWKYVKYLNSSRIKTNFYWVQSKRLAFSNPSLSPLSQSLTCTASGWDGCFRVSPNSIRQINFFLVFTIPLMNFFFEILQKLSPRCSSLCILWGRWQYFTNVLHFFKFKRNNLVDVPCFCILWGQWQFFTNLFLHLK